jgi:hypothetical protein
MTGRSRTAILARSGDRRPLSPLLTCWRQKLLQARAGARNNANGRARILANRTRTLTHFASAAGDPASVHSFHALGHQEGPHPI